MDKPKKYNLWKIIYINTEKAKKIIILKFEFLLWKIINYFKFIINAHDTTIFVVNHLVLSESLVINYTLICASALSWLFFIFNV